MAVASFLLGSASGALAAIAGSYAAIRLRRRHRAEDLRAALRSELETLAYLEDYVERGEYEELTKAVEPAAVYEANAGELGRLDADEVRAVVRFYTDLGWLRDLQDVEDKTERVGEVLDERERALEALGRAG